VAIVIETFMKIAVSAAIDAPGGFLFEWWSVFWDIFIARTNDKHSEVAAAYLEVLYCFQLTLQYRLGAM
jgi:hypothetical protein